MLSYTVAQRTREIGIRATLGSSERRLVRLITMEGLLLVAAGVVLGFGGGVAVTRLMPFMLYGVSPLDATTWGAAALLLVAAATVAPGRAVVWTAFVHLSHDESRPPSHHRSLHRRHHSGFRE